MSADQFSVAVPANVSRAASSAWQSATNPGLSSASGTAPPPVAQLPTDDAAEAEIVWDNQSRQQQKQQRPPEISHQLVSQKHRLLVNVIYNATTPTLQILTCPQCIYESATYRNTSEEERVKSHVHPLTGLGTRKN